MIPTELLLNKLSAPGLWFVKSNTIVEDISHLICDLAVNGAVNLNIYSSEKDRIVNSVISMITKERLQNVTDSDERFWIEDDLSFYYECGHFWKQEELNDYIPNGSFWENQVQIHDFDPLFVVNSEIETILVDGINDFKRNNEASSINALQQTHKLALQEKKTIFVFVSNNSLDLTNEFIRHRLINP